MKLHTYATTRKSMKRILLVIALLIASGVSAFAQEGKDLYSRVSPSIVYIRHELYLSPDKVTDRALWKRLEDVMHTQLLSSYFPVMTGSGFFVDGSGRIITNRHVASANPCAVPRNVH